MHGNTWTSHAVNIRCGISIGYTYAFKFWLNMRLTLRWQAIYLTVLEEQHSKGNYGSLAKYCPPSDISTHLELIVFAVVGEVRFKYLVLTKFKILTPDIPWDVPFVQILTIYPKICPALLWLLYWQIHFEKTSPKQFFQALMLIWCEKLVLTVQAKIKNVLSEPSILYIGLYRVY